MKDDGVEGRLAELFRNDEKYEFATLAIQTYSAELYGFLTHLLDGAPAAADVLAQTIETFWHALPEFRAACSVRTWLYLLARRCLARHKRQPRNRRPHTGDTHLTQLVAIAHSRTAPWQQTAVKTRFRELRAQLDPDDRILLVLRVDRDMEWHDIAHVTLDAAAGAQEAAALVREAARLRKRFQQIKVKLRRQARDAGLMSGS
jgi:RNA polymerase sigma-70 factor, ECF subfamily